MNKRFTLSCIALLMSVMTFAQGWVEPKATDYISSSDYAKDFVVSTTEPGDTTVYYLYNVDAGAFLSQNTCPTHAQWSTSAALRPTGNQVIVEKYTVLDEDSVQTWDGKTYTIWDWYSGRYREIFPTSWYAMFVDFANQQDDHMWEIISQGNGIFYIKSADANPNYNDAKVSETFGETYGVTVSLNTYLAFNALDNDYLDNPAVMPLTPMLDPDLASKVDIEAVGLFTLMEGVDAKYKWAFIPEAAYQKYAEAINAYNYAPTFLAYIESVEANYPTINTAAARAVYNNYNVSTYADMQAAIADLEEAIRKFNLDKLAGATEKDPVDATDLLVNPNFDGNISGWVNSFVSGTTATNVGYQGASYTNGDVTISGFIEAWAAGGALFNPNCSHRAIGDAQMSQTIVGLPAGKYSFSCDAIANYQDQPNETVKGVYLFAKAGIYEFKQSIATGNEKPEHFELTFVSVADTITFGLKTQDTDANWIAADNFTITYYGPVTEDPYLIALRATIEGYEKQYPYDAADVYCNAAVKDAYLDALTAAKEATTQDDADYQAAGNELIAAANKMAASAAEYNTVKAAIARCESETERFASSPFAGIGDKLGDLHMLLEDGYADGTVEEMLAESEDYAGLTIAGLSAYIDQMIIDYITENVAPGDEVTALIKNADFDTNFSGWDRTGATPAWGGMDKDNQLETGIVLTGGNAEVYHAAFNMSQLVKNMPKGSYTLSVQAFERNDNGYLGHWAEGPEAGITAVLYCNDFTQKVHNIMAGALPEQLYNNGGWQSDVDAYGDGTAYIPNSMTGSNYFFNYGEDRDLYQSKINFTLMEDGDSILIGLKTTATNSWVIFDNFRLFYNGADYSAAVEDMIAKLEKTFDNAASYGNDAKDRIDAVIAALKTATAEDDILAALKEGNAAYEYAQVSISVYTQLEDVYFTLAQALGDYSATAAPSVVTEADLLLSDLDDLLEARDKNNEEVQAILDQANALVNKLKVPDTTGATYENPVEVSDIIVNSTFDTVGDFYGWSGTAFGAGGNTSTNAEHYEKTYDTYQDLIGLPEGYYVAYVQGFYRHGSATNDYSLYTADDHSADHAFFYAVSTEDSVKTPMQFISSAAITTAEFDAFATASGTSTVGDGLVVPNYMTTSTDWFNQIDEESTNQYVQAKYYNHFVQLHVAEDGKLRIGVKKQTTISTDWSIFDNFRLFYIGSEPDPVVGIGSVLDTDTAANYGTAAGIFNLQGQKLAAPQKGINIINGVKVLVK